jgi:apolipoprotein N-acyltransferase
MAAPADAQRERAVDVLKRAYAEGRLELEEFEARAARALAAHSPWELRLQLRGLMADDVERRVRRGAHVAGAVAVWAFLSFFLAVSWVVALLTTHMSAWTLAFPVVWLLVTVLALREVRRSG